MPQRNCRPDLRTLEGEAVWHVDDEGVVRLCVGTLTDANIQGGGGGVIGSVVHWTAVHLHPDLDANYRLISEPSRPHIGGRAGEVVGGELSKIPLQSVGVLRHS